MEFWKQLHLGSREAQKLSIALWPSGYEPMTKAYKLGACAERNTIKVNSATSIYHHIDTFKSAARMLPQRLRDAVTICSYCKAQTCKMYG